MNQEDEILQIIRHGNTRDFREKLEFMPYDEMEGLIRYKDELNEFYRKEIFSAIINRNLSIYLVRHFMNNDIYPEPLNICEAIDKNKVDIFGYLARYFKLPDELSVFSTDMTEEKKHKLCARILDNISRRKNQLLSYIQDGKTEEALQVINNSQFSVEKAIKLALKYDRKEILRAILEKSSLSDYNREDIVDSIIKYGDIEIFNMFLEKGIDYTVDEGSAVNFAVRLGKADILEALLNLGLSPNGKDDEALKDAAEKGNENIMRILLDKGADVHAKNDWALMWASRNGHFSIVKFLLEKGADIHAKDDWALRHAVNNEHLSVVNLLLENGANVHADDESALIIASNKGNLPIVKRLVQAGANIHARDEMPLSEALDNSRTDVAYYLLENGAIFTDLMEAVVLYRYENDAENILERIREIKARRIQATRENEEKGAQKRQKALQEYIDEEKQGKPVEAGREEVMKHCSQDFSLLGEKLMDMDDIVIFIFISDLNSNENNEKGECYLKSELKEVIGNAPEVALWIGPPSGVIIDTDMQPGKRSEEKEDRVYKLPFSGIWITENAMMESIQPETRFLTLQGEKKSIGSSFGVSRLHGQWGGHWAPEETPNGIKAVYVEDGNAQPDERYKVYTS